MAAGIGAASMTGLTALLVLLGGVGDATAHTGLLSGSACATSGPIAGFSDVSAANGRVVAAVSVARGGDRAALIALMTGLAESGLRVLTNPSDPSGDAYPSQGVGSDHASLAIFQQQPWWGTAAQRMEPVAATNLFLDRLLSLTTLLGGPRRPTRPASSTASDDPRAGRADRRARSVGGSGYGTTKRGGEQRLLAPQRVR